MSIQSRVQAVRDLLPTHGIDGFLVLAGENRLYLSGFSAEDHQFDELSAALLITIEKLILITDSRFDLQARQEAPLYTTVIHRKGLAAELPSVIGGLPIKRIGFESARLSVAQFNLIRKALDQAGCTVEMIPVEEMVEKLRLIKTSEEIQKTQAALALAEEAFLEVVKAMQPGMSEKAIAWALEKAMREAGADSLSFPTIVAAGPNSALPHAVPSDRPIREGEPILFDWGARCNGYCSDTSRTVVLGTADDRFQKVYDTVFEAQQRAIQAIRAGANSKEVDAVARDWIAKKGYEGRFGHGLGHGTGLVVHEGPRLSPLRETTLESGMIVTVEPGIYLPDWGGVRIENQVAITDQGVQDLNRLNSSWNISQLTLK